MALTQAQLVTLKADILADPVLNAYPINPDGAFAIAEAYNALAVPDYMVWRTDVTEEDCTSKTSAEGTNWIWTAFIARGVGEQTGWVRMFSVTGKLNAANPNVRQGIADIFSGNQNSAPAQRVHLLAVAKRKATRAEKLFASGVGSLVSPATMTHEGTISYQEVLTARELP